MRRRRPFPEGPQPSALDLNWGEALSKAEPTPSIFADIALMCQNREEAKEYCAHMINFLSELPWPRDATLRKGHQSLIGNRDAYQTILNEVDRVCDAIGSYIEASQSLADQAEVFDRFVNDYLRRHGIETLKGERNGNKNG